MCIFGPGTGPMKDDRSSRFRQDNNHFRRTAQPFSSFLITIMMLPRLTILVSWIAIGISPLVCKGLYLGANDENAAAPFALNYVQNGGLTFNIVFQSYNESVTTVTVLAWQAVLQIQPLAGSQGTLVFQSTTTPANSMFGSVPGPLADLTGPSDHFSASDTDTLSFTGTALAPSESRNMLEVTLSASSDARGSFEIMTPVFDPMTPDVGTAWLEVGGSEPQAFENAAPSSVAGYVRLGTIEIGGAVLGDYTGDGLVNGSDYTKWRQDFGSSALPAGSSADGNQNGIVDAADYVVWREHRTVAGQTTANIPEPGTLIPLVVLVMLLPRVKSFRVNVGAVGE